MTDPTTTFAVRRRRSSAAEFHALDLPDPMVPEIWIHEITGPAVVLGSTQRDDVVDHEACRAAGVDVVRRRSGGGAVLLVPGDVTWVDVLVPTTVPWWSNDIHTPMIWLGEHVAALLADAGLDDLAIHRGGLVETPWSRMVCFDGLGAGEVTVGGRKLVGISQRRTRAGARLQACWYRSHQAADLVRYLAADVDPAALTPIATVPDTVSQAVVDHLAGRLGSRA